MKVQCRLALIGGALRSRWFGISVHVSYKPSSYFFVRPEFFPDWLVNLSKNWKHSHLSLSSAQAQQYAGTQTVIGLVYVWIHSTKVYLLRYGLFVYWGIVRMCICMNVYYMLKLIYTTNRVYYKYIPYNHIVPVYSTYIMESLYEVVYMKECGYRFISTIIRRLSATRKIIGLLFLYNKKRNFKSLFRTSSESAALHQCNWYL